jgi:DNA-binding NarL/FixJ family response regulator
MSECIRILLVDDDSLVRRWLRMIIEPQDDLTVVGDATDGLSGVALARELKPDVVITDIRMTPIDGVETTRRLVQGRKGPKVLVLTTFDDDQYVYGALQAGASGFLLKSIGPEELLAGIRLIASGDGLLSPQVTRKLIDAFAVKPLLGRSSLPAEVTDREREVLIAVSQGLTNSEIAQELSISLATAKSHVSRLLFKLGARERAQLVISAYESGVVVAGANRGQKDAP